jgi:arabinogalactan oligomer/maltooligosaccharide transport system permease protein
MSEQLLSASAIAQTTKAEGRAIASPKAVARSTRPKFKPYLLLVYAFLVLMTIFAVFPLYFVLQASLRGSQNLYSTDLQLFPDHLTLDNYSYMLTQQPLLAWIGNSIYVCVGATVIGLFCSTTAAYALSRFRFAGRDIGLMALLAIQAFPSLLALLAYYLLLQSLGLIGHIEGLMVVYAAGTIVFGVWNIKGYFDTLPIELEQAALVDGATPTQAFLRITLPLAAPALAASALFMFIGGWNEFPLANILLSANDAANNVTWPVGLNALQSNFRTPWGYFAAASVMISVPVMILFIWLQRFFQSGLTVGSVKG